MTHSSFRISDAELFYYMPDVDYKYTVNGEAYAGDFISLGAFGGYLSEGGALEKASESPVKNKVTVYYDPDDPSWALFNNSAGIGSFLYRLWPKRYQRFDHGKINNAAHPPRTEPSATGGWGVADG